MVQYLQAVNKVTVTRAPTVPDPHTLLNELRPDQKYYMHSFNKTVPPYIICYPRSPKLENLLILLLTKGTPALHNISRQKWEYSHGVRPPPMSQVTLVNINQSSFFGIKPLMIDSLRVLCQ